MAAFRSPLLGLLGASLALTLLAAPALAESHPVDLEVFIDWDTKWVVENGAASFYVVAFNDGTTSADTTVTFGVPEALVIESSYPISGGGTVGGDSWTVTLAAGSFAVLQLNTTVAAEAGSVVRVTAAVAASKPEDPDTGGHDSALDVRVVPPGSVAGEAWVDGGDGVRDDLEDPLGGVTVELLDEDGSTVDSTITGEDGTFVFTPGPGTYRLRFAPGSNYQPAPANEGGDDRVDSDVDPDTLETELFAIGAALVPVFDAGFLPAEPAETATTTTTPPGPVEPPAVPPIANDDRAEGMAGREIVIEVLRNDGDPNGDPLEVASVSVPTAGAASVRPDQKILYVARAGFSGVDSFEYTIADPGGLLATATVTIDVEAPEAPAEETASSSGPTADLRMTPPAQGPRWPLLAAGGFAAAALAGAGLVLRRLL